MRGSSLTLVTIAILVLSTTAACHRADEDAERASTIAKTTEEAKAIVAAISTAYNAHDAAKAASYDAPQYVSMFHGFATATGPAADIASMKEQFKDPAATFHLTVRDVDVARSGEMVVVRCTYSYDYTDPTSNVVATETGNWVTGLKRQPDGSLKMIWSIGADESRSTPQAAAAP